MNVQILATGSSGNSVCIDDAFLIDAGISVKEFRAYQLPTLKGFAITHKHTDHMKLPLVRRLLTDGIKAWLPPDIVGELTKEGKLDVEPLLGSGQITLLQPDVTYPLYEDVTLTVYPQKHHDIVNYAFVLEKGDDRLLYSTDLDTVEATEMGVGLLHLGQFDTILLEGNYDESYLRAYIEYMVSLVPEAENPKEQSDADLEAWVKANYRKLPDEIARNAFRAIQNHRHLSKQQARAYAAVHLKPNGRYYEIHRSRQFYEEPEGWREQ